MVTGGIRFALPCYCKESHAYHPCNLTAVHKDFLARRKKIKQRQQTREDHLYGVFAEGSSDEEEERRRRAGKKPKADYTKPVAFVSKGVGMGSAEHPAGTAPDAASAQVRSAAAGNVGFDDDGAGQGRSGLGLGGSGSGLSLDSGAALAADLGNTDGFGSHLGLGAGRGGLGSGDGGGSGGLGSGEVGDRGGRLGTGQSASSAPAFVSGHPGGAPSSWDAEEDEVVLPNAFGRR